MTAEIDSTATLTMTMPNGVELPLTDSTLLKERGNYRLLADVQGDTLTLSFTLTGEENKMEVSLKVRQEEILFDVTQYLPPLKEVEIEEKFQRKDDWTNTIFLLTNNSEDTLFGYFLPNYMWGWLEVMRDSLPTNHKLYGRIDLNFVESVPFLPHTQKYACVASFGRYVPPYTYRFHLLYSTRRQSKDPSLVRETAMHRWFTSVQSWHHLTYDFEIKAGAQGESSHQGQGAPSQQ